MKVKLDSINEDVQISIIPLIDVIFCILTFFLLAAVQFTRQQAINVDLPKASTGTSSAANGQNRQNILPVTIDAVGLTYIEKEPVKKEDLEVRLRQYVTNNPNGILVLNASRTATYNNVIETLDLLRKVGGSRVSLGIIPGSSNGVNNLQTLPNSQPGLPNNQPINTNPSLPSNSNEIPIVPNNVPQNTVPQLPVAPGNNSQNNNSPARN
ncbi:biopolymer transporter ExbD [Anabaena sp. FACHB-1237]|uniref:ExbD/TolR family protein n=1 Tax=Anabaena sp. FACHB-1237 TaxID=2692769 RepID=UPI001680E7D2|nr:biopolymer transporter ExbD [Anabaena sp. FACHB-1237]MBD2136082.1 biopolymer transporter ExbD [Anabaena sp. FACHB-1237]